MNFMSVYANIYNWTRVISKIFLIYLPRYWSGTGPPIISYNVWIQFKKAIIKSKTPFKIKNIAITSPIVASTFIIFFFILEVCSSLF